MEGMMGVAAVLLMAVAVAMFVNAATSFRLSRMTIGPGVDVARVPSIWFRVTFPLLDRLSPLMSRIGWSGYRDRAAAQLQRAGFEGVKVDHLLAMKVLTAIALPAFFSLLISALLNPGVFVLAAIGAFCLPDYLVAEARKARERKVVRALPGAVDVLSLSVEAGLDFLAAIQRLVERSSPGPLRDEMATVLNDVRLGTSRA